MQTMKITEVLRLQQSFSDPTCLGRVLDMMLEVNEFCGESSCVWKNGMTESTNALLI